MNYIEYIMWIIKNIEDNIMKNNLNNGVQHNGI